MLTYHWESKQTKKTDYCICLVSKDSSMCFFHLWRIDDLKTKIRNTKNMTTEQSKCNWAEYILLMS